LFCLFSIHILLFIERAVEVPGLTDPRRDEKLRAGIARGGKAAFSAPFRLVNISRAEPNVRR
jgi:hypothetical protein